MTVENEPEFTHEQGLAVGGVTLLFGGGLSFFGGDKWAEPGVIAFAAIAATVFIQRRLLRRPWFIIFVVSMVLAHLGLVFAFPEADLTRGEFKLLAFADMIGVFALAYGLEKLMTPRK